MKEVHYTKKIITGFGVLSATAIVFATVAYFNPAILNQFQSENTTDNAKYSFEKPGQKIHQETKTNQFSGLTPQQLNLSAIDIITRADAIMMANPIEPEPMTTAQKQQMDQKISKLDQQIKTMEGQLDR